MERLRPHRRGVRSILAHNVSPRDRQTFSGSRIARRSKTRYLVQPDSSEQFPAPTATANATPQDELLRTCTSNLHVSSTTRFTITPSLVSGPALTEIELTYVEITLVPHMYSAISHVPFRMVQSLQNRLQRSAPTILSTRTAHCALLSTKLCASSPINT
jgi:hypothetical protein